MRAPPPPYSVVLGTFFFIRHQRLGLGGMGGGGGAGGYGAARPAPRTMSPEQIRALPVEIYEGPQAHHRRCAAARGSSGGGGEGSTAEGGTRLLAGTPLHYRPEPVAAAGGEAEPGAGKCGEGSGRAQGPTMWTVRADKGAAVLVLRGDDQPPSNPSHFELG